ncbi:MAG: hypothetical protein CME62_09660 [Halobacteriovoraceae bacterium]|nr:hypothetical protein [Halobacteriovoraceae bacterium]|tara:strand:- start:28020 stop:28508 length:489 start_codon:yes stop_codon:yes gene_type:complete
MKVLVLISSFIILAQMSFAQESTENNEEEFKVQLDPLSQKEILKRVEGLKTKDFNEFVGELNKINIKVQEFIQNEKEACSKLHATQLITKNKLEKEQKRPLSKKEKQYCKLLLVNFQIRLNKVIHEIRKDKLALEHKAQMSRIEQEYQARIVELEKSANKLK